MPQSNAARPPEPSSTPALRSNSSSRESQVLEEAPASDSEAETERLHESPVKRRAAEEPEASPEHLQKRSRGPAFEPEATNGASVAPDAHAARRTPPTEKAFNGTAAAHSEDPEPAERLKRPVSPSPSASEALVVEANGAGEDGEKDDATADGAAVDEDLNDAAVSDEDEVGDAEDDEDEEDEGDDDDDDEDDDANDEERLRAISALTEIEIEFAEFRDKLHDQQIARFDLEIEMCTQGVHPELQQYHVQIREEHEKRLHRSQSLLAYQMRAIFNHSHAGRRQVHQTHLKSRHALRGNLLGQVTRDWYRVNYERRAADREAPEFGYVADSLPHQIRRPTVRSMGIHTHASMLFPPAPRMICANDEERDEDLRRLGLR